MDLARTQAAKLMCRTERAAAKAREDYLAAVRLFDVGARAKAAAKLAKREQAAADAFTANNTRILRAARRAQR